MDINVGKEIKIAGFTYKVIFKEHDRDLRARDLYGQQSGSLQEIKVDTGFSQERTNETFLHEMLHAVDEAYNNAALSEEENTRLSAGLHQVFEQLGINFIQKK